MKSGTDDGLSSCSKFQERPSPYELESDWSLVQSTSIAGDRTLGREKR